MAGPLSPKQELKTLSVLFTAMITGVIIFGIIIVILGTLKPPAIQEQELSNILLIISSLLAVAAIFVSKTLYIKKLLPVTGLGVSLQQKLVQYRSAMIAYLAVLEFAALFAIVGYFLTNNAIFIGIAAFMALNMFLKRPSRLRIFNDLNLDSKEQMELT